MDEPKCRQRKRYAVRKRERADGEQQSPSAGHQEQQPRDEQQMVHAGENVLDPRTRYVLATSNRRGAASTTNDGAEDLSRVTCDEPSVLSSRTSTSVSVAVVQRFVWFHPPDRRHN